MGEKPKIPQRGDSFDIDGAADSLGEDGEGMGGGSLLPILKKAGDLLAGTGEGMDEDQIQRNVQSLITGAGAGTGHRLLANTIGSTLAGAIAGAASGWIAGKLIRRKKKE